jgi:GntR family transcriptional repressor for pyruvate dehydrogenase complex
MADAARFTPRRRKSVTRDITDHLRRQIVAGALRPDRPLPSMRNLAEMYGVSLPTMQCALHALASMGFVHISHGVGVFVARPRSPATALIYACKEATPVELAGIRAMIDERAPVLAARAVAQADSPLLPGPLRDLKFLAAERSTDRNGVPAEVFVRADLRFHRAIVASVMGAEVMSSLYDQVGRRLMPHLTTAASRQARDQGLDQAHLALATAIIDGQMPAAARLAGTIARREAESVEPERRDR